MRMQRLLLVGCGDIALRAAAILRRHYQLVGLLHDAKRAVLLRSLGITPIAGDLDRPPSLLRLAGIADAVLHFAPPENLGHRDVRTARLLAALAKGASLPRRLIYISTSGVYGNCAGERVDETRPIAPRTSRAHRRADAERRIRAWGRRLGVVVCVLRVPGIYAHDRLPLARLKTRTPALRCEDDSYSNHIHADDLARIAIAALRRGKPGRIYHASDDGELKMGDYFDLVADRCGLARPPRITRAAALAELPENLLSFMLESRRLNNTRSKRELRVRLIHPTVADGLSV